MFRNVSSVPLRSLRHASTGAAAAKSTRPSTFRLIVRQPMFKSIFLTLLFGSVTIDLMRNRKNLEALESTYKSKLMILEDIIRKLESGQKVDIASELRLANSLTQNRYNSVTDIEFDESLEKFLREVGNEPSPAAAAAADTAAPAMATPVLAENHAAAEAADPSPQKTPRAPREPVWRESLTSDAKRKETAKFL